MAFGWKAAALRAFTYAALAAAASLICGTAFAAAGPWWRSDQAQVRLIAANDATGSAAHLALGLEFKLIPGWKIYWRSPGDAGYPPRPNWAGSENLESVTIRWPLPHRFSVLGLETLGYKGDVVLPLDVAMFEPGKPLKLRATVPFLTCDEICVPYDAQVALDLPAGPQTTTREAALINRFAAEVPRQGGTNTLRLASAFADGPPGDQSVRVIVPAAVTLSKPDLFVEGPPGFRFAAPRSVSTEQASALTVAATPPPGKQGAAADLVGKTLTFTLVSGGHAVEQHFIVAKGAAFAERPPPPFSWRALAMMIAFAVAGGLILNLMPCVLPVLSLKLLSVVGHAGGPERAVRRGFVASAAGIVTSFLVLATVAVALKLAGMAAGWGIQFQQPLFLVAMALLLVLFAANLWGLFEFRLPGRVADVAATAGNDKGMTGHFLTGAFATLLATPCSAPFLGTAVGFALARGPAEIYAIFAALGVGMSLPYLLVAAIPHLATRLPRSGGWMVAVRRVLGLALAATAVWLLAVLGAQAGRDAALLAAGAFLLILVALLVRRLAPAVPRAASGALVGVLAAVAVAAPLMVPTVKPAGRTGAVTADETVRWVAFDPAAIAGEIAAGHTVFVDVTADWCLTCQVNKALVIDSAPIQARLNAPRVVAMRADWTRPDPVIAAFLHRYGRFGIPFNVVFGPGTPAGRVLPELLSRDAVVAALDAAAGDRRTAGR